MSDILEKFNVFSKISDEFKLNIKQFHVFDDIEGKNVFFATKCDKVFAFGNNRRGQLGFGHGERVDTPTEIQELNGKHVKQFFIGEDVVLALNENNYVFGWGRNNWGQLVRGYISRYYEYLKPDIISELENITEINCGNHCLALNSEGIVFSWGYNMNGQVGCGKQSGWCIRRPVQLKQLPKIKSIHCFGSRSFAVTFDGYVYSWGDNEDYCLGHESDEIIYEPKLIIGLNNVISVGFSFKTLFYKFLDHYLTYFLTNEENIHFCGKINGKEYQKIPKNFETNMKFQSLQTIHSLYNSELLALSGEEVYYLEKLLIKKTKFKTFSDYFSNERQITLNTIEIKELNFSERFQELSGLGSGGFGQVFRAKDKSYDFICAIKKILNYENFDEITKEVDFMKKCNSEYVVKYFGSKLENNCFYIIMELMDNNLDQIIEEVNSCRTQLQELPSIEYFICSHLMKELLECVQYLHEIKPNPIIHRDLKPQNILVNYRPINNRFLKICDFGISTHGSDVTISHTRWKGTPEYTAPEVWNGEIGKSGSRVKYSTKADIYSLGKILYRIFNFEIMSLNNPKDLIQKWTKLEKLTQQMTYLNYKQRPTCSQILEKSDLWLIKKNKLNLKSIGEYKTPFIESYLKHKLKE